MFGRSCVCFLLGTQILSLSQARVMLISSLFTENNSLLRSLNVKERIILINHKVQDFENC